MWVYEKIRCCGVDWPTVSSKPNSIVVFQCAGLLLHRLYCWGSVHLYDVYHDNNYCTVAIYCSVWRVLIYTVMESFAIYYSVLLSTQCYQWRVSVAGFSVSSSQYSHGIKLLTVILIVSHLNCSQTMGTLCYSQSHNIASVRLTDKYLSGFYLGICFGGKLGSLREDRLVGVWGFSPRKFWISDRQRRNLEQYKVHSMQH